MLNSISIVIIVVLVVHGVIQNIASTSNKLVGVIWLIEQGTPVIIAIH